MDKGPEAIGDAAELAQVRRQARKVHVQAIVTAMVLTVLVVAIPEP
jgi:hypothetical protein